MKCITKLTMMLRLVLLRGQEKGVKMQFAARKTPSSGIRLWMRAHERATPSAFRLRWIPRARMQRDAITSPGVLRYPLWKLRKSLPSILPRSSILPRIGRGSPTDSESPRSPRSYPNLENVSEDGTSGDVPRRTFTFGRCIWPLPFNPWTQISGKFGSNIRLTV